MDDNEQLKKLKCIYFFELAIISCLYIYMTPFMSEWGITAMEMAIINFVANIFAFLTKPCFGYIADRYWMYKQLIMSLALLCGVIYGLHLVSPKHPRSSIYSLNEQYNLTVSVDQTELTLHTLHQVSNVCWSSNLSQCYFGDCNSLKFDLSFYKNNVYHAHYGPVSNMTNCKSEHKTIICEDMTQNCNNSQQAAFKTSFTNESLTWSSTFWILGLAKFVSFILYSSILSLTDAVTFVTLGSTRSHEFGPTRKFGTIGTVVFSLTMAAILWGIKHLELKSGWLWVSQMQRFSQFTPCFIMALLLFAAITIAVFFLHMDQPIEERHTRNQSCRSRCLDIMSLDIFRQPNIVVFFIFTVFGGILLQVFLEYFFLIIYMRYHQLPKYFFGLITVIMTMSELVFLEVSPRLLKLKGHEFWVSLSFLAWSLRWFSYLFCDNFWFLLLTELLHGPSFGLMFTCLIAHIGELGNERTQGRIQGLFSGVYFNIGGAFGGLFGGMILNNYKMFVLFKFMFAFSLIGGLYYPMQYVVRKFCLPLPETHGQDNMADIALLNT